MHWQPHSGHPHAQPYQQAPMEPHRGGLILGLGLSGLMVTLMGCVACGPFSILALGLTIPAIVMARRDLRMMTAHQMDPSGRDNTNAGMVLGIVGSVLAGLVTLVMGALLVIYRSIFGLAIFANMAH